MLFFLKFLSVNPLNAAISDEFNGHIQSERNSRSSTSRSDHVNGIQSTSRKNLNVGLNAKCDYLPNSANDSEVLNSNESTSNESVRYEEGTSETKLAKGAHKTAVFEQGALVHL